MKRLFAIVVVLAAGTGAAFLMSEGYVPGWPSDKAAIRQKSVRFLECLKFKNFEEAAVFHTPAELKDHPNIPKQLESFFKIPHENLDIQDINIDFMEFDSTGARAKVKTTTGVHVLNSKEDRRVEAMIYWKKVDGQWFMDLRTTLERGAGGL
ncbi:MAG: hypothetical protein HY927_06495 [Elusimicrobia bacterium]|nr:hypothetical protein [Elusimicrobiota bacterium]